jgi:hypothetical protein
MSKIKYLECRKQTQLLFLVSMSYTFFAPFYDLYTKQNVGTFVCSLMVSLCMLWLNRTRILDKFLLRLLEGKTGDTSFLKRLASSLEPGDFRRPLFNVFSDICALDLGVLFRSLSGTLLVKLELYFFCRDLGCSFSPAS